jgi:hypothetical protein
MGSGLKIPEKFKSFPFSCIRQIFKLPSYTPHWFLYLETMCSRIELSLLKNTLSFYVKLLSKPKSSLMYECLQFLKTSECRTNMKLNWFRDLRNLLAKYDLEDLLENDLCTLTLEYLSTFKNKIWKRLEDTSNMFMQQNIVNIQCSSKTPLYKMSRTHCYTDRIMNSNVNWNYIILYVQIKSGIPRITFKGNTVTFNAMNSYFNRFCVSEVDMCNLCSLSVPETVFTCSSNVLRIFTLEKVC